MTYQLMSPHMKDNKKQHGIKDLQRCLAGTNPWRRNWSPGKLDGVYGPATAGAVKRAKWELGFPNNLVGTTAGQAFIDIVSGKKPLPKAYKLIALKRKKRAQKAKPMRASAFAQAKAKLGVTEKPAGSNRVEFSDWYGLVGPWCAMFVSWCYVQAKSKSFVKGQRYAYVPYILADAMSNKNNLSVTGAPEQGDLVLFDWNKDGVPDHIGLFDKWVSKSVGTFNTVEGNTAVNNDSNGGEVMARVRNKSQVRAFIRVSK